MRLSPVAFARQQDELALTKVLRNSRIPADILNTEDYMLARHASTVLSLLAALTLVATACTPASPPSPPGATSGGSVPATQAPAASFPLRIGVTGLVSTMDPHASIGPNPRPYGLYECLVAQDENGKLLPALATEWKNLNPTTWQFKLAPNRKFHDGNPVTAEDIKYSFDRAINPDLKLGILARTATIASADIVDSQ